MNKRNMVRIFGIAVILWGAGVYSVNSRGMASCTPETGFTGLMHQVLFAPTASCATLSNGSCQSSGSCQINPKLSPGGTNAGKCTTTKISAGKFSCACVAN